jgi:hypothetical protein
MWGIETGTQLELTSQRKLAPSGLRPIGKGDAPVGSTVTTGCVSSGFLCLHGGRSSPKMLYGAWEGQANTLSMLRVGRRFCSTGFLPGPARNQHPPSVEPEQLAGAPR